MKLSLSYINKGFLSSYKTPLLRVIPILFVITTIISSSCTEKMDINLGSTYTRLSVDGNITLTPGNQYVRLTKTTDYFANEQAPQVSGATVIVDDGILPVTFTEDTINLGYYNAPHDYVGVVGNTYKLSIKLNEPINESTTYEAIEKMPPMVDNIDSIVVEYNDRFKGWMVRLYAWDPPETNFYMFNGLRNGIGITDSVELVDIRDDRLFNGEYIEGAMVLTIKEDELQPGDVFTLVLSNITEEYANFYQELQAELRPKDPMFSGPPANVSSNINNDAVGYFSVFPSAYSSTIVKIPKE